MALISNLYTPFPLEKILHLTVFLVFASQSPTSFCIEKPNHESTYLNGESDVALLARPDVFDREAAGEADGRRGDLRRDEVRRGKTLRHEASLRRQLRQVHHVRAQLKEAEQRSFTSK